MQNERAYAYAKACGIIGKSFIGKRAYSLHNLHSLSELDRLVFPETSRDLPEKKLLSDLEKRISRRAVDSIIAIIECFSRPEEFLTRLLRSYEYADLKTALVSFQETYRSAPSYTDLRQFQTVRFKKWPDIKAMIEGTEFEFLLENTGDMDTENDYISLQTTLDRQYYNLLWKSLLSLPRSDRYAAGKILKDEISIKNSTWVLRLRTYYRMSPDEIKNHLISIPVKKKKGLLDSSPSATLADEALACLELPLDNYEPWSSWHWKDFLNSASQDRWNLDPRYFQNSSSRYLYRLARHHFRLHPFSLDTVFCFIKMKQFEEDVLTSSVEGIGVGMSGKDVISSLGVES